MGDGGKDDRIFDESDALEKTGGDQNLLVEVLSFALEDLPKIFDDLSQALLDHRYADASKMAHKAKGIAGTVGARRLYETCLELELAAKDRLTGCRALLPLVDTALHDFTNHPKIQFLAALDGTRDRR